MLALRLSLIVFLLTYGATFGVSAVELVSDAMSARIQSEAM